MSNGKVDFAIINYWWCDDHGAILTAYALQYFLTKEGYSSELLKNGRGFDERKREGGISKLFEERYMKSSKEIYSTYDDIFGQHNNKRLNEKYIGFITGSDQVFRLEYAPDSWFLTFVKGKGKIAVAASFGVDKFICDDEARVNRIAESLNSFDFISVREDTGVDICQFEFGMNAFHMLDPVFLINKKIYEDILKTSSFDRIDNFIFCYIRDITKNTQKLINKMKGLYGLEVVMCHKNMKVEDFLYCMANCKHVITDSYHGMCFSIIFNKSFLCIRNVDRGKTRFESLQRQLGLSDDNFIDENEESEAIAEISYLEINKRLKTLSEKGADWLKNALIETYRKYGDV